MVTRYEIGIMKAPDFSHGECQFIRSTFCSTDCSTPNVVLQKSTTNEAAICNLFVQPFAFFVRKLCGKT